MDPPGRRGLRAVSGGPVAGVEAGRLAKTVGVFAILASAVSQEYGSGIVLPNSLGKYPGVAWAVPIAMLVAGLLLIPRSGSSTASRRWRPGPVPPTSG